jgi:tRNA(fMet)-specific endonuclease VapC
MEITRGFEPKLSPSKLQVFRESIVPSFDIIDFDLQMACLAGEIYAKLDGARAGIGLADTAVAAVALRTELTLVSSNVRHFQRVVDLGYPLRLENWRDA